MPIRFTFSVVLCTAVICLFDTGQVTAEPKAVTNPMALTAATSPVTTNPANLANERSTPSRRAIGPDRRFRPGQASGAANRGANAQLPFGIPRVAGLSITVDQVSPVGPGMEVDFSVQLTTVREVPLSFSGATGSTNFVTTFTNAYDGGYIGVVSTFIASNNVSTFTGGSPQHLGTLDELITDVQRSTYDRQRTDMVSTMNPSSGLIDYFGSDQEVTSYQRYSTVVQQRIPGALPGIDFGDGSVQATTTLPLTSIVSTTPKSPLGAVGLRTSRFRRSSFSHVYASQGPQQIVVNSGCCSLEQFPFDQPGTGSTGQLYRSGNFVTTRTVIDQRTTVAGSFSASGGRVVNRVRTNTGNPSQTTTTYFGTDFQQTFADPYLVDQVSAAATVDLGGSVLEIPSLSSLGLGLLAILLSSLGVVILRRG